LGSPLESVSSLDVSLDSVVVDDDVVVDDSSLLSSVVVVEALALLVVAVELEFSLSLV
jgi:hypothetical protein